MEGRGCGSGVDGGQGPFGDCAKQPSRSSHDMVFFIVEQNNSRRQMGRAVPAVQISPEEEALFESSDGPDCPPDPVRLSFYPRQRAFSSYFFTPSPEATLSILLFLMLIRK